MYALILYNIFLFIFYICNGKRTKKEITSNGRESSILRFSIYCVTIVSIMDMSIKKYQCFFRNCKYNDFIDSFFQLIHHFLLIPNIDNEHMKDH